jgi:hypothetical protein
MASSQLSLLTATPARDGHTESGWRIAGVRRYITTSPPANPVSASAVGTTGTSSSVPVVISAADSSVANCFGGIGRRNGKAAAAVACRPVAPSSSVCHFPRPSCRM